MNKWVKKFEYDDSLPQLSEIHEGLEQFEGVPLDSPGFNLSHRDRMICFLYTVKETSGMTSDEIADQFGLTRARIYAILRKDESKRYMSHLNDLMFEELWQDTVREMRKILKKSHSESNKIKVMEMVLKSKGMYKNEMSVTVKQEEQYDLEAKKREIIEMDLEKLD
ncbi:helix-turn-helix transcriptional regulator [Jeotgalibacillus haloalkalitolerans]|uniref:Homeodomain phBC6A51-type domain-containing protein n=1 Tax=Jeotgalibacillus haloalkalitolerans TaxID=3104292 RepID=A0ABU5KNF7_9BACL|nr:phBC6A51 family helix-turn-helix protein [Jeotgalibacillus sp. HH7-29]MDZ5712791.1 hypothetical protein [Jeotgalibacillus sp. HH7-29]